MVLVVLSHLSHKGHPMPPSGFCILASKQTFMAGRVDTARSVPGDRRGAAGGPTSESLTALRQCLRRQSERIDVRAVPDFGRPWGFNILAAVAALKISGNTSRALQARAKVSFV